MKRTVRILSLALMLAMIAFVFASCASMETYEKRLDDAGYDVDFYNASTIELVNGVFESEGEDYRVISAISAENKKNYVFIYEFGSSSEAKAFYEDESSDGYYDKVEIKGSMVIMGTEAAVDTALGK